MTGSVRAEERSLWASRGSEGGPVAVVMASGGEGLRSVRITEEGGGECSGERMRTRERGRRERGSGAAWLPRVPPAASR